MTSGPKVGRFALERTANASALVRVDGLLPEVLVGRIQRIEVFAQRADFLDDLERKSLAAATVVNLQAVQVAPAADEIGLFGGNRVDDARKLPAEFDRPHRVGQGREPPDGVAGEREVIGVMLLALRDGILSHIGCASLRASVPLPRRAASPPSEGLDAPPV